MKDTGKDISVILPIHELLGEDNMKLFKNALDSVSRQKVLPGELLIVVPKGSEVEEIMNSFSFKDYKMDVRVISNDGKTDFSSQVNYGVSQSKTEWVSILEFDDEYSNNWFHEVGVYQKAHDDVEIFMPIIVDVDQNGEFMGTTNELAWANSFTDEIGLLNNDALLTNQSFSICGMVIKKSMFEEHGGFKSTIKLMFTYEFLLRMTFKQVKTMVIPRYGYRHMNQRVGSLFQTYRETVTPIEANWWLAQAKKEYYFPNEREITYEESK